MMLRIMMSVMVVFAGLMSVPLTAKAADICPLLRVQVDGAVIANRIAAAACEEHLLWFRPFIDREGRLASLRVTEAETSGLGNGQPAWQKVAAYWSETALLGTVANRPGASDCQWGGGQSACRNFVVDVPWSAAFISWVMRRAAVPGFYASASHVDYVREAFRNPQTSPYRAMHPNTTRPRVGDMLCFVRSSTRLLGWEGLSGLLQYDDGGLPMHCDIFTAINPNGDGMAYLVGGNVMDAVTMRIIALDRNGMLSQLPQRLDSDLQCTPDTQLSCDMHRQDWGVLMQLRSPEELAQLPPAQPLQRYAQPLIQNTPGQQSCCVYCMAGGSVPRCPDAGAVQPRQ